MATGLMVALAIGTAVSVGSEAYSMYEQGKARKAALKEIEWHEKESTIQYQQKTLANYNRLQQYLSAQTAMESVRGVGFNSAGFNAIQRHTINMTARQQQNIHTGYVIGQANAQASRNQVNEQYWAGVASDIMNIGSQVASVGHQVYSSRLPQPGVG